MKKLKILILLFIALSSCKPLNDKNVPYNFSLNKLIFSDRELKSALISTFDLGEKTQKILKVLISRRDRFVRITIYQLINKTQLSEYPASYFTYNLNTFLCYDGSELIANKKSDHGFIKNIKNHLQSGDISNSKVLQFDIALNNAIIMHNPAIDPYDVNVHISNSPPISKPVH